MSEYTDRLRGLGLTEQEIAVLAKKFDKKEPKAKRCKADVDAIKSQCSETILGLLASGTTWQKNVIQYAVNQTVAGLKLQDFIQVLDALVRIGTLVRVSKGKYKLA